ncbi:type III secretion system transcriptional activator MxiE, partial [Shigella sonnei]|nr:transcriptional regulator [Shigella sonnei]ELT7971500.1 transcriptional regulator [Shigella sonnei]HCR6516443.1 transcriptional regulator [Shigella flexneri]
FSNEIKTRLGFSARELSNITFLVKKINEKI